MLNCKKQTKDNKAISLVALNITIIILLILAGVTIASLTGSGLFSKTESAKIKAGQADAEEEISLKIAEMQVKEKGNGSLPKLVELLNEDTNNTYTVTLNSNQTSSLTDTNIISQIDETTEKIYVTNIAKGYEVEVTSELKVAATGNTSEVEGETEITISYLLLK